MSVRAFPAIRAALEIKEKLLNAAWETLGYHPDTLVLNDRRIYYKHDPAIGMSYLEALHKAQEDKGEEAASNRPLRLCFSLAKSSALGSVRSLSLTT